VVWRCPDPLVFTPPRILRSLDESVEGRPISEWWRILLRKQQRLRRLYVLLPPPWMGFPHNRSSGRLLQRNKNQSEFSLEGRRSVMTLRGESMSPCGLFLFFCYGGNIMFARRTESQFPLPHERLWRWLPFWEGRVGNKTEMKCIHSYHAKVSKSRFLRFWE